MDSVKQTPKKLIALLLSFVLLFSAVPVGVFSVFAQQQDEFSVILDGYNESATVTLTQSDDNGVSQTITADKGKAVFENFYDDEKTYNLNVTDLIGYNDYEAFLIEIEDNSYTVSDLVEINKVTISGTVVDENEDAKEDVKVSYSAYDGKITGETKTDIDGKYSLEVYSGVEYKIDIDAGEKYYTRSTTVNETVDKDMGEEQLQVKEFAITTTVGQNGSVNKNLVTVKYGEDAENIIITADEHFIIESITIDGESIEEAIGEKEYVISQYFNNVKESHTVNAAFIQDEFQVEFTITRNGKITIEDGTPVSTVGYVINDEENSIVSENKYIKKGQTISAHINDGKEEYHIESFKVDSEELIKFYDNDTHDTEGFVFDGAKAKVSVVFALDTFEVIVNKDENGNATVNNAVVPWNTDSTITIIPNNGYDIDTFTVSTDETIDTLSLTETPKGYVYTINNVTEDVVIDVTFKKIDEGISVSDQLSNEYYTITFSKEPVVIGDKYIVANGETITIEPNEPYKRIRLSNSISSDKYTQFITGESQNITYIGLSNNDKIGGWDVAVKVNINFVIDNEAPIISDNFKKRPKVEYHNSSYEISVSVTDGIAGVEKVLYSTENNIEKASEASYELESNTATFITTDKEYNGFYYIWAVDKVGNISQSKEVLIQIDNTKPTIDNFEFSSSSLNPCDFGTFSNDDIAVKITASDDDSSTTNSGVKEITFNGETKTVTDGSASFTLKAEDFEYPKAVSAYATDNAGNSSNEDDESKNTIPSDSNSNIKSNIVTISSTKSVINITKSNQEPQYANGSEIWYDGNNEFTVNISDTYGIKSVIITMNDKEVINDILDQDDTAVKTKIYTINTSENALDGQNVISVKVVNVTNISSEKTDEVYIDTTKPDITGFEFTSKGTSVIEKVLNFLTFGNFFNEKIEIKVSAKDDNASSGIKEITLYGDEVAIGDPQSVIDGVATFEVPAEEITNEKLHLNTTISAKATDNVGNTTKEFVCPSTTNSDTFADSGLMIETIKPTIKVDFPEAADNKNSDTADKNDWYANDIDFDIVIHDSDSGIRNVEIKINDVLIDTDKDSKNIAEDFYKNSEKTTELEFRVNTDQVIRNEDGSYTITIIVTDNAGNVSETYTKTIYKDTDNPTITDFKFEATGYHNDDDVISANQAPIVETTYGYYFVEDTKVTVTSHDVEPTAGIKTITYYTVDKDGGKSEEVTKPVNENNQITFIIPANFKGQIYAKATDNVDNTPEEFVNPNSAIVESPELHEATSSIKYTPAEKDVNNKERTTDSNGNFLYAANAKVDVEVIDSYSGIRQIDWEIISPYDDKKQAGTVTVDNETNVISEAKEGYSADCLADWNKVTEDNLVTKLTSTFTISNNSNNIQIKITLTDRAGNVTKDVVQVLSIDKTAPKIVIQMNENDDDTYSSFFKVDRTVDVYVYERNFKSHDFNFVVTKTDDNDSTSNIDIKSSFKKIDETVIDGVECYVYKMSHTFTEDGDYDFSVNAKDFSDNKTVDKDVKYSSDKTFVYAPQNDADRAIDNNFTIDQTTPEVTVTYDNNNNYNDTKYFNNFRTATITLKEHNFTSENNRITYTRTATKDGGNIEMPAVSSWSKSGNIYTATIRYGADGDYTFGIDVMDKAGNEIKDSNVSYSDGRDISKDFTIDTTINKPVIGGVENGKSYKEEAIPTINIDDVNYASSTIQLLRTQTYDIDQDVTEQYIVNRPANRVTVSEDTFEKVKENDGIYTLSVSVTDMAGNTASDSVMFTVNRFGSVYRYSDELVALKDTYKKAVDLPETIVITEYNPDRLVEGSVKVELTRDNSLLSNLDVKVTPRVNNTVAIGESGWYQYDYEIPKANFEADGIYALSVSSEDEVGNEPDSTNDSEILFRVDSTPPEVISVKGLEKARVNALEQSVDYSIYDAIGLESIEVHVNNIAQDPITEFDDLSNFSGSFVVPEGYENEVRLVIKDLAGNITDTGSDDFKPAFDFNDKITISTNIFVLWYSIKPLFWGSIGGVAIVIGLIFFLAAKKHRKKDDEETQPNE